MNKIEWWHKVLSICNRTHFFTIFCLYWYSDISGVKNSSVQSNGKWQKIGHDPANIDQFNITNMENTLLKYIVIEKEIRTVCSIGLFISRNIFVNKPSIQSPVSASKYPYNSATEHACKINFKRDNTVAESDRRKKGTRVLVQFYFL